MKTTFTLLLLLSVTNLIGQERFNISGVVTSGVNGEPLDLIVILVNGSSKKGAVTDSLGNYNLALTEGTYTLTALWIGYEGFDTTLQVAEPIILNFKLTAKCEFNNDLAISDISKGKAKLLIDGSISFTALSPEDKEFAKRYNVTYYNLGDAVYALECLEIYNSKVFEHLDKNYGTKWREAVRSDVINIKK